MAVLCTLVVQGGYGQSRIETLAHTDPIYQQHQTLVAGHYAAASGRDPSPPLMIMTYLPKEGETLFDIAARLMLPYSSISTLNRLDDARLPADTPLLIPTRPGLFVYPTPRSPLEELLEARFSDAPVGEGVSQPVRLFDSRTEAIQYPGTDFSPDERQLFLRIVFTDPLPEGAVSSAYGYRTHPITGIWSFHYGTDFAGDFGQPVYAAAAGRVHAIERDPWLGLSLTLEHAGEYSTRYAHLQEVFVQEGTYVERGATIGAVGSTGFSTGPHLHFEVLHRGLHQDPVRYLLRERR